MRLWQSDWLRRLFLSLGGLLIFAHNFVAETLLRAGYWSAVLYPGDPRHQMLFVAEVNFALIPSGCACLLAAWWLGPNRRWKRIAAMLASAILVFGFPLLMPFATMCFVTVQLAGYSIGRTRPTLQPRPSAVSPQ